MTQGPPPLTTPAAVRVWFDFVDPLSYLLELELCALDSSPSLLVERVGFELVAPPAPLTAIDDPTWSDRLASARPLAAAAGIVLAPPRLVPWTRKAHELHLHAQSVGKGSEMRLALYRAHFEQEQDIGRIDRLVAVAEALGLDPVTTRTVLGVDRHEQEVVAARSTAAAAGVADVPALSIAGRVYRGFHNQAAILTLVSSTA